MCHPRPVLHLFVQTSVHSKGAARAGCFPREGEPGAEGHPSTDNALANQGHSPTGPRAWQQSQVLVTGWLDSPTRCSQQWSRSWVPPGDTARRSKRDRDKLQCIIMAGSIHESIPRAEVQVYPGGRAKGRNAFHVAQKDTKGPGLSLSGVPWVWGGGPRWGWSGQLKAY